MVTVGPRPLALPLDGDQLDLRRFDEPTWRAMEARGLVRTRLQSLADPDGVVRGRPGLRELVAALDGFDYDERRDGGRLAAEKSALADCLPPPSEAGVCVSRPPRYSCDLPVDEFDVALVELSSQPPVTASEIDWSHAAIRPAGGVTRPSHEALQTALTAYENARQRGMIQNPLLTVIDYSLPSSQPRLWIIDMEARSLWAQHYVAHGAGSADPKDKGRATRFSNRDGSHQSNLGLLTTGSTYQGKHGRSLVLHGREPGFNDAARSRAIVMHSASYVAEDVIQAMGRAGTSWGCPALDPAITQRVIDRIMGGSAVFGYYPDSTYLAGSDLAR